MHRVFLGTDTDALNSAADRILGSPEKPSEFHKTDSGPVDLRNLVVVVPGRRVRRRLLQLLLEKARLQNRGLLPPRITTPGHLEQTVAAPGDPIATALEDRIAWLQALRTSSSDILAMIGLDAKTLKAPALLPLAKLLSRLCSDLRRDGITLGTAAELAASQDPQAALRLRAVESIETKRSAKLQRLGLADGDTFSAPPTSEDLQVILIGILEMPVRMRQWLDQHCQTEAWIDADPAASELYDDSGCPIPEQWEGRECPQPTDLIVSDDPRSLTAALLDQIHQCSAVESIDDVTIGLVDPDLTPWLVEGFHRSQIPLHIAAGSPHCETSCGRLLADLRTAVETLSSRAVAALARHPAIHRALPRNEDTKGRVLDPIESIDRWSTRRQPVLATDTHAPTAIQHICKAIEPLRTDECDCSTRIEQLLQCLKDLVGVDDRGQPALPEQGLENLVKAAEKLSGIGYRDDDPLSGLDVVSLLIDLLEETPVPDRLENSGIDVLGWLELPFDGAPVLLLTGPSEGRLSPAPAGDPLLPHGVREELEMSGPRQRSARDAHILQTLLDGRRKTMVAMCARDGDGNPSLPSRLLLQGPEGIDRLAHFLDKTKRDAFHLPEGGTEITSPESLGPPLGVLLPPPTTIAVTAFADWLQDPVLFQMNRILRHRDCHDRDRQLNPADFGIMIHKVLEQFGKDPQLRDLSEEDEIREALHRLLDRYRKERIANPSRSAVLVQLEQARVRLDAWATVQAEQRALGWRLVAAEVSLDPDHCRIVVPEGEIGVSGRIDRIDYHEQDRRWRLLDYKTGDQGHPPEKDHRRGRKKDEKNWIKLQLPLYRMFADQLEVDGVRISSDSEVGFFLLPASPGQTRIEIAGWDADDLESAREQTEQAVAAILTGSEQPLSVLKAPWKRALAGIVVESAARLDGISGGDEEEEE